MNRYLVKIANKIIVGPSNLEGNGVFKGGQKKHDDTHTKRTLARINNNPVPEKVEAGDGEKPEDGKKQGKFNGV